MAAPDLRAAVRHGAAHLETMAAELEHLEHGGHAGGNRYADLQHRFDILGGYTLDQRVDEALSGLGFARDEWLRPPTALSGGQQTRAALARLVVANPDLLLLDEPTNHLDINAIEWLEEHLRRRSGALLVASHDRAFLDATVTRVWELRDRRLTVFRGDYSAYHRQRVERDLRAEKEAESQADAIEREVGAGPALPQPAQAREDARARGAPREAQGRDRIEAPRKSSRSLRLHGHCDRGRAGPLRRARRAAGRPRGGLPAGPRGAQPGRLRGAGARDRGHGAVPGRPARRADRHRRPQRRRQDDAAADDRGRPAAARRDDRLRPPGPAGLPRPAPRRGDPRAPPSWTRSWRRSRSRPARRAGTSPGSCSAATTCSRRSGRSRAASGRASSSRCSGSCRRTCCSSTSPRTTWTSPPARRSRPSSPSRPATLLVVSHDRRLLETICERLWVVDEGLAVPFDGGYRAWRQAVADGWTVAAEAARRQNRLRPGTPGLARHAAAAASGIAQAPAGRKGGAVARRAGLRQGGSAVDRRRRPPRRGARSCPRRPTGAAARPSTRSWRASACARASWSSRSGRRRSPPTSSRCAA